MLKQRILMEGIEEIGNFTKLEKVIMEFINRQIPKEKLPENFHGIAVDVYNTQYGKSCKITFLMKKPFSEKDSDDLHDMSLNAKNLVKSFFNKKFPYGVTTGTSTIKHYKETKDWYDSQKDIKEMNLRQTVKRVLSETTKEVLWLRRRLHSHEVMRDLKETVIGNIEFLDGPCGYDTSKEWFDSIMKTSVENFISHWEELYDADDMVTLDDFVYEIINDEYGDMIRKAYKNRICD